MPIKNNDNKVIKHTTKHELPKLIEIIKKKSDDDDDDDQEIDFDFFSHKKKEQNKVYRKDNHIYFYDNVTQDTIQKLIDIMDGIKNEHKTVRYKCQISKYKISFPEYYLHINTTGGDLYSGFLAYDYLSSCNFKLNTVSEGYTISAGTLMFMAGKKKYMRPNSLFLIHQLSSFMHGMMKNVEINDENKNCKVMMNKIINIYINNLNNNILTRKKLVNILKHDRFLDVDKCMYYGFVDEVYYDS